MDFIDEVGGCVCDDAHVFLETNKDVYFTNDHLLKQVEKIINTFERIHPQAQGIFLLDNAPSHHKVADDALIADKINAGPGGKQLI